MFRFSRFLGIFGIVCACMFSAHSAVADTVTLTLNCGNSAGTVKTVQRNLSRVNCDVETQNGYSDGTISVTRCDSYTLPTRSESGCPAISGKDIIGWRAGNSLWMFKPGNRISHDDEYTVAVGPEYTAVWGKTYGSGSNAVTIPFELVTTNLSDKKFTITIAAKGSYTVYCDLDNGTTHKATGPSSQSNNAEEYVCSYNNNSPKRIGITGTIKQKKRNVFNQHKPVIMFGNSTTSDTAKIASIDGSLGAVFNSSWAHTFGMGGTEYVAPSYKGLFEDAVNLTSPIPKHLFAGSPTHAEPNKEQLTNWVETFMGVAHFVGGLIALILGGSDFYTDLTASNPLQVVDGHLVNTTVWEIQEGGIALGGAGFVVEGIALALDGINKLTASVVRPADLTGSTDGRLPNDLYALAFRPKYYKTFKNSGVTGDIPDYLFGNLLDVASTTRISWNGKSTSCPVCAEGAFAETFWGCSGLTSIPDNLFGKLDVPLYYKPRNNAFRQTFNYCTGLTSIPAGLFKNATGYAPRMFEGTFKGCYNIVGQIPADLFANVGAPTPSEEIGYTSADGRFFWYGDTDWWDRMFSQTFAQCNKLGGVWTSNGVQRTHFVPSQLFGKKSGRWANNPSSNFMQDIFDDAGKMAITCPSGYTEYVTGFRDQWGNGTGSEKVISCELGGSSGSVTPVIVSLDASPGSGGTSYIYQVYDVGWSQTNSSSSNAYVPSTNLSAISVPNLNGYEFLGYFSTDITPITPTGRLNVGEVQLPGQKIQKNGKLVYMQPNLQNPTTWYATWVQRCENLTYEHGSCTTQVTNNGSYQYILTCDTDSGYHLSNDEQSCEPDNVIYAFTLNKNGGTGGTAGPLYEKYGAGWALSQSSSSWSNSLSVSKPSRSGYRFVGYFSGAVDEEDYLLEENDALENAFVNNNGLVVATPNYSDDGNLYAVYARECDTTTATQYHATCQLSVGARADENDPRRIYVNYDTNCNTGYIFRAGDGTYQPKCGAIEYNIWLDPNGATSNYSVALWASYDGVIRRPDDYVMGINANAVSVPVRQYNITYNKNASDATLATLTDVNTKGTYSLKGFYNSPTGTEKYVGSTGYITQLGLDVGTHYTQIPENGIRWYAQWESGTVTLPVVTRPGYSLQGWYTQTTGGQKRGNSGETYTPIQNETLYAHWTPKVYEFEFNDNNNDDPNHVSGLAPNECSTVLLTYGEGWSVSCTPRSGGTTSVRSMEQLPTRAGYVFAGYYVTKSNGNEVQVVDPRGGFTENYNIIPAEPAPYMFNAHWSTVYTITLNPNGGSGGASVLYELQNVGFALNSDDQFVTNMVFPSTALPARAGYTFNGYWNLATGGTQVVEYVSGTGWRVRVAPTVNSNNVTWYAQWAPKDFEVTLNDNGGSGGLAGVANKNCKKAGVHYGTSWYNVCPEQVGGGSSTRGEDGEGTRGATGVDTTLTMYSLPTRNGYVFAGYYKTPNGVQNGDVQIVDTDGNFLNTDAATTAFANNNGQIYANWINENNLNTYDITLNPNETTTGQTYRHIYELFGQAWYKESTREHKITAGIFDPVANGGAGITISTPTGTIFGGYYTVAAATGGEQIIDSDGTILVSPNYFSGPTTIYARWISPDTTVTLDPNGGTPCAVTQVTATYGSPMPRPSGICSPSWPGYDFLGYYATASDSMLDRPRKYYNSNMTSANNWDQPGATATIYARWSPKNYTVSYKCSASGSVATTDTATSGETYSVKDFGADGDFSPETSVGCTLPENKVFVGWAVSNTSPQAIYNEGSVFVWDYTENKTFTAQFVDVYTITFTHPDATNTPSPAEVYLVPGDNWYYDANLRNTIEQMSQNPSRTGFTFDGYWTTDSGEGVQIVNPDGFFQYGSALNAYATNGKAYARWNAPDPDFVITTTPITAGQTFSFSIAAMGTFIIDWGDSSSNRYQTISNNGTNPITVSHRYVTGGTYPIGVSSYVTKGYNTSPEVAAISFSSARGGTPQYVASISGSLGAAFPSLASAMSGVAEPVFYETFKGCSNLEYISGTLFSGVTGARENRFNATFQDCTSLVNIPSTLFNGVSGMASSLFMNTFKDCTSISAIPTGLFDQADPVSSIGNFADIFNGTFDGCWGITSNIPSGLFEDYAGAYAGMFKNTFRNCSGLTGSIPSNLFSAVTGGAEDMFNGTFQGCVNLTDAIPGNLFQNVSVGFHNMFAHTFDGCSNLNGNIPSNLFSGIDRSGDNMFAYTFAGCSRLSGSLPYNLFSGIISASDGLFNHTFYGCTGLSSYIPDRLFENLEGQDATDFMSDIFYNSGLDESCPAGMIKYEPEPLADYWAPKVSCVEGPAYRIALNANGGTVVSGTTTEMIYEKYNTGWSVNQNGTFYNTVPSSTIEVPIVLPTKTTYDFLGYFDDPENGSKIIDETGHILVNPTHFATYSDNPNNPDATLYAHWNQGVDWVFTATTTTIPANGTVKFKISAAGKFYVDCGTGGVLSGTGVTNNLIDRTGNTTAAVYTCTYTSGGASHQIKFGRKPTDAVTGYNTTPTIPTISFYKGDTGNSACNIAAISGSLGAVFPTVGTGNGGRPSFYQTFRGCTTLTGSIPSGLFNGVSGSIIANMFGYTFSNTGLSGTIPGDLFSGLSGGRPNAFNATFADSGFTSIGGGLFANINGGTSAHNQGLFASTFSNTNITSVPVNLFSNALASGEGMFSLTFAGCNNLTTVPETLFAGVTSPATDLFHGTFAYSGLSTVPGNLFSGITSAARGLFRETFMDCADLRTVPAALFNRITGAPAREMFDSTFAVDEGTCGLISLPTGLFAGLSGAPAQGMFSNTFAGCSNMVGQLSPTMFAGIVGAPASSMFFHTFYNCAGLQGSIPAELFSGINGPQQQDAFKGTFEGCTGLTSYVPPALFVGSKLTGTATDFMSNIFMGNSNMLTECPTGMAQYITGFENYWGNNSSNANSKVVSCSAVYTITLNDAPGSGGNGTIYWMPGVGFSTTSNGTYNYDLVLTKPQYAGYVFNGYRTATNGGGTPVFDEKGMYDDDPSIPSGGSTLTLYAQWTPKVITVTLNDMGATSPASPQTLYLRYKSGFYATAAAASAGTATPMTGITSPIKTGYWFRGYFVNSDGTGRRVINNQGNFVSAANTFTTDDSATIYAHWEPKVFNITYNYNGGFDINGNTTYIPVEYISANGSSYFDSLLNISRSYEIRTRFERNSSSGALYGNANSGTANGRVYAIFGSDYETSGVWRWGTSGGMNLVVGEGVHSTIANYAGITLDGVNHPLTLGADFTTAQTLAIASNKNTSNAFANGFKGKIYGFEIDNGTNVLFNGVPVKNANGVYGLLDVSDPENIEFKTSANVAFGGGAVSLPTTYASNVVTTINGVPTRAHSDFVGWCTDAELENCALSYTLPIGTEGAKEYWAKWTCRTGYTENNEHTACVADTYTISFNLNGGTADDGQFPNKTITYWTTLPAISTTAPTKPGYTFMGWYDNADYSNGVQYYNASDVASRPVWDKTQSATLYAGWKPGVFAITLRNETNTATNATIYEKYADAWYSNSAATTAITAAPLPTREGYTFRGYYNAQEPDMSSIGSGSGAVRRITNAETDNLPVATTFVAPANLYAAWAKNCPNLGNTGHCTLIITSAGAVVYNTNCNTGYIESNHNTANVTCTAGEYTLTYTCGDGDGTAPSAVGIEYGAPHTFLANTSCAKVGHSFAGWRVAIEDPQPANPYQPGNTISSWNYTSGSDIVAQYTPNNYTLSYSCGTGATGTIADQTVEFNSSVPLASTNACSKPGYVADGWDVSGSTDHWASGATINPWNYAGNKTFTVKWNAGIYRVDLIHPDADIRVGLPNPVYLQYNVGYYSTQNAAQGSEIDELTQIPQRTGHEFTGYYQNLFNKNTMVTRINASIPESATTWTSSSTSYSVRIPCQANKTYLIDFGTDNQSVSGSSRRFGYVITDALPTSSSPVDLYNGFRTTDGGRYYTLETGANAKYIIVQVGASIPGSNMAFWNNFAVTDTSATPIINFDGDFVPGSTTFTTENATLVAKWNPTVYNISYDMNVGAIPDGSDYVPVEYIESADGSYINTGISGYGTWDIDAQATQLSSSVNSILVGYNTSAARGWFGVAKANGKWGWGGSTTSFPQNGTTRVNASIDFASNAVYARIAGRKVTSASGSALTQNNYRLMRYGSFIFTGKLYSAQFRQSGGQLMFNGIPVRRVSDDVCGLYDTVSGTFKSSADTTHPFSCPTVSGLPVNYTYGVGATINGIPSRAHATFDGWCPVVNGVPQMNNCAATQTISTTDTGDKEYWAKWTCNAGYTNNNNVCKPNTITLHYTTAHGTAPTSRSCVYDDVFNLPDEIADASGYSFDGWKPADNTVYAAGASYIPCTATVLGVSSGTANIAAVWANGQYQITLNGNGATTAGATALYTIYDTGVYRNSLRTELMGTAANAMTSLPQKNNSVTYSLAEGSLPSGISNPQTVSAVFDGYGNLATNPTETYIGANGFITNAGIDNGVDYVDNSATWYAKWNYGSVTLPLPTRSGYTFTGWYQDVNNTSVFAGDENDPYSVASDVTLTATWSQCNYTAGDHSSATYTGTNASNQCVYTVTCDTGYSMQGGVNSTTSFTATGDAGIGTGVLPACRARNYSITYDYNGGEALPVGATQIESVGLDRNVYINTMATVSRDSEIRVGFVKSDSEFRPGAGVDITPLTKDVLFGATIRSGKTGFNVSGSSTNWIWNTGSVSTTIETGEHNAVINKSGLVLDGTSYPFNSSIGEMSDFSTGNVMIGTLCSDNNACSGSYNGAIRSFQIIDAYGDWKFNGIPVYIRNGGCGLYDTVSRTTFVSSGSSNLSCMNNSVLPSSYTYGVGTTITGTVTREHSIFDGWCLVDGGVDILSSCPFPRDISENDIGNKTFRAKWICEPGYRDTGSACEPDRVFITYMSDHDTPPSDDRVEYNGKFTLPAELRAPGYNFVQWRVLNTGKSFRAEEKILCNEENLGAATAISQGNPVRIEAVWSTNTYNCNPGYYLPAGATACAICTAGSWCPGGGFEYDGRTNQGINRCPAGYADGGTGRSAQNQCAMDVRANYYVATANAATATACATGYNSPGGLVYYGDTSECDANIITLTFANGGHGGTAPTEPTSCKYDQSVSMPEAMTENGYTFGKWAVNGTNYEYNAGATTTCDLAHLGASSGTVTISATWIADSYNINYEFNGGFDPRNISGYTPVDYIESDGANYINIGVPANILIDWAEITYKQLANASGQTNALFGNYNDASTGYNFILSTIYANTSNSRLRSYNVNNSTFTTVPDNLLSLNTWHTLGLDTRNRLLINESVGLERAFSTLSTYAATAHSIPLFAGNCNGTVGDNSTGMPCGFTQMQLRDFALYEATSVWGADYSIKFHGIPMRRNSDNVCGLLNIVDASNPVFRTSAVSGHPLTCPNTVSYPVTYTHGTATTVASAPTREHSRFMGWCTDAALTDCGDANSLTIPATATGNKTLYAKWECNVGFVASGNACVPKEYTITLDNANATTDGTSQLYAVYAEGVYTDAAHTNLMATNANPITKPVRQYTVTYNPGAGTVSPTSSVSTYTFTRYANSAGYTVINGSSGLINTTGILHGRRLAGSYTGSSSSERTWTANWNSTNAAVTLPLPFRSGYVFDGWWTQAVNGVKIGDAGESYTPDENITMYAHWRQCGHTAGAHSSATVTTNASNQCVYNITCDTGYSQLGGANDTTSFSFTADTGVVTGTLAGCSVRTFNVAYTCEYDWNMDNWLTEKGVTYTKNSNSYTITNLGTAYSSPVVLPTDTYRLSIDSVSMGENAQNPRIEAGILENGTFTRVGWVGTTNTTTITEYTGEFNAIRLNHGTLGSGYTFVNPQLNLASGATTGTAPTDDTVTYGTQPTLPSTAGTCARTGHTLTGWRPRGESANWTNGSTWTYLTDKTFVAQWSANQYNITYDFQGGTDPRTFIGYTPVEYIESTGGSSAGANQYIDTTYHGNPNTRVFADYQLTKLPGSSNSAFLFGDWKSNGDMCFSAGARYSGARWLECSFNNSLSTANVHSSTGTVDLNRHQFVISGAEHLEYWTDVTFQALDLSNLSVGTTTNPFTIFTSYGSKGTAANRARMKLFGFQISEVGTPQFTGIPVRQIGTDTCGLLDISDTTAPRFYDSDTSTPFSCPTTTGLPATYTYGNPVTIGVVPTRANARFMGWCPVVNDVIQTNDCDLTKTISDTDTGNKVFAAKWECDTGYTNSNNVCVPAVINLSYVVTPATGTPTNAAATCTYNQAFNMPASMAVPGYSFSGWGVGGNTFDAAAVVRCDAATLGADAIANGSATITAQFTFDPKFTIVTTNMTANDTFTFHTFASGTFVVDWDDGSPVDSFTTSSVVSHKFTHTYTTAGVHNIRIGGRATRYSTRDGISNNNYTDSAIFFYNSGDWDGTPTKIASVTGSMGAVFPTLGSTNGRQPRFYRTFDGATNLTSVSSTLFSGVTGAETKMFSHTFKNCSKLANIPNGLFDGVSGNATEMFHGTFLGCSKISSIPSGLFAGVSGSATGMFQATFQGCSKITAIPSGLFNGVTGSAPSLFFDTFYNCSNLVTIPTGLFRNVSGGASQMFMYTFSDCPKITEIPAGLFDGVTVAAENIFSGTFMNDVAITDIPNGLFRNLTGGASGAFWGTFMGCTGLTGPIPANMFQNITVAAENEFAATFYGATHLSGYVPPALFDGLNGANATDMMGYVFDETNLAEECPCGTHQYITGYESDWSDKVACEIGLKPNEHWYNNQCVTDCDVNVPGGNTSISKLKTSGGLEFPILSTKPTTIALNFGMANNAVCYAPLEAGNGGTDSMNISYNNSVYHVGNVSSTAPAGWDPMAELVAAGLQP